MRKNKIIMPALAVASVVPAITTAVSCNQKSQAELVMEAIIDPTKITTAVPVDSFVGSLKALNEEKRQKEVIYDLFGCFHIKEQTGVWKWEKSLVDMYKDNTAAFKTNITKCSLSIDDSNKITSTFLGYVSFVFTKEVKGTILGTEVTFKENDYVMLTYDFFNANVTLDENNLTLTYTPKLGSSSVGFYKVKYNGGAEETIFAIPNASTANYTPKNSHNWVKK